MLAGNLIQIPFCWPLSAWGVEPEFCVALEDSYHGVRAASGAGMMTIMVPDLLPPTREMEELCVAIVEDLHAVCAVIK
jgi:beta-phosphoglucomutase-like phosphatase (HAD superfamily)